MKPRVLVIVGPTASGKSDLAVKLAKKFKGEVISADSRQVYKGLDIGTGKITKEEMQSVPHYLLSIADPKKQFSASEYRDLGLSALRGIVGRNKLPIIVGGTGFYIDAVTGTANLPEVPANPAFRQKLEAKSAEALHKLLTKKDPLRAKAIDPRNKVRVIRALEIVEALGKVPPAKKISSNYHFIFVGLKPDQKELEEKIYARIIKRLPGMIREAKELHTEGLPYKRMEALGLEYRYLARLLQNKISKKEFTEQLFSESKKYSKRQYTWFKRNKEIKWFLPGQYRKIEKGVQQLLDTS